MYLARPHGISKQTFLEPTVNYFQSILLSRVSAEANQARPKTREMKNYKLVPFTTYTKVLLKDQPLYYERTTQKLHKEVNASREKGTPCLERRFNSKALK